VEKVPRGTRATKLSASKSPINHRPPWRALLIALADLPACQHRNLHGGEEPGAHRQVHRVLDRISRNAHAGAVCAAADHRRKRKTHATDSWKNAESLL